MLDAVGYSLRSQGRKAGCASFGSGNVVKPRHNPPNIHGNCRQDMLEVRLFRPRTGSDVSRNPGRRGRASFDTRTALISVAGSTALRRASGLERFKLRPGVSNLSAGLLRRARTQGPCWHGDNPASGNGPKGRKAESRSLGLPSRRDCLAGSNLQLLPLHRKLLPVIAALEFGVPAGIRRGVPPG